MLHGVTFNVPAIEVARALWRNDAVIGPDGSVLAGNGTYGFAVLIHLDQEEPTLAVTLGGHMPEIAELFDMDSHRPESAALYAFLVFAKKLLADFPEARPLPTQPPLAPPPEPRLRIVIDNKV
jgi:hypothetical protein